MHLALTTSLSRFNIGEPTAFGGLKVFPLFPLDAPSVRYRLAPDALDRELAHVAEAPECSGPWFRTLRLHNHSLEPILLREADLLRGGKQDRVVDQTCLVPPVTSLVVPVSCIEAGRSHGGGAFSSSRSSAPSDLRRMRMVSLAYDSNATQSSTWGYIAESRTRRGLQDGGGSLNELARLDEDRLADFEAALPFVRGSAGLAIATSAPRSARSRAAIGVEIVELFSEPECCAQAWPGLVRAAAGRLPAGALEPRISRTEVRKFFAGAEAAQVESAPNLGLGTLERLRWTRGAGAVLVVGGRVAHAALLAA